MKNIDVNEIYTLFEEIKELVKAGNRNNTSNKPLIDLPDLSAMTGLSGKLDEAMEEIRKPARVEHRHIFSIASNKVFFGVIGLCIACLVLLFTVINQQNEIASYKDNDLKYRYIQMRGEASVEELSRLENIFTYNRDKDSIGVVSYRVKRFEHLVKVQAEKEARARLNDEQAEQLKQQAEIVREKK